MLQLGYTVLNTLKVVTMTDLEISSIAQKVTGSPRGISAVFVKVNEKWGVKLFRKPTQRDTVMETQRVFANAGYGPEVGNCVDLPSDVNGFKYGYFCEIVETCIPHYGCESKEVRAKLYKLSSEFYEKYGSEFKIGSKLQKDLQEAYDIVGFELSDMNPSNLGWKNGKIIPIDFGCD